MKTNNHSEIGWHMILGAIVFLMLVPIVFALSNSFKTLQDAFNTIFGIMVTVNGINMVLSMIK